MNKMFVRYDRNRFSDSQNQLIDEALEFAVRAHEGQVRATGQPYVIHPIAVAEIVADWGLDHEAVMAGLLHDVVEDTPVTAAELKKRFGAKVGELVEGVTKLRLSATPRPAVDSPRSVASNENLRKLLLASTKDYRVLVIKLADRLHNMRTLAALDPDRRVRIGRESLEIYGPLADRLGMGRVKTEIEDLGFEYGYPGEYEAVAQLVRSSAKKAGRHLAGVKRAVVGFLAEAGVGVVRIEARQKGYYSIYKKLAKVDGDIDKMYDLVAVRIIVPDVAVCYQVMGILHQHYKPLIYRIKDYIAVPKPNGYQSLHTTVFAEGGRITEIQIRTPQMHEAAEFGLAAHFYYEAHKSTRAYSERKVVGAVPRGLDWARRLTLLQKSSGTEEEFVEGARLELFGDRLFVFSPKGDLYDLPEGSTPLDFAFAVHSEVGLKALGARVNGRMVQLDRRLENRDVVEIVTRRVSAPSRDWLGFVVTAHARSRLRAWFKSQGRAAHVATGRQEVERVLAAWGIKRLEEVPKAVMAEALDGWHLRSVDDLAVTVADGGLSAAAVVRRLVPEARVAEVMPSGGLDQRPAEGVPGKVLVEGEELPYSLAPCCEPVFPQPLVGYVTRGRGVTVHVQGCRNMPRDVERLAACRWRLSGRN